MNVQLRVAGAAVAGIALALGPAASASAATDPGLGSHRNVTPSIVETTRAGGQAIGLTFDDGPNPGETEELLEVLDRHHVKAVFCVIGRNVAQHPDIVREIVDRGHTLCNHSMTHPFLGLRERAQVGGRNSG